MKLYCPKCQAKLDAGPEVGGTIACPACGEPIDMAALRAATCPICGSGFGEDEEIRICPDCRTPHHDECWEDNHGCSTYGCRSAAHQMVHTSEDAGDTPDGGGGVVACPACGAMHPTTDLVCGSCGKLLGDALPGGASAGARIRETAGRIGATAKQELWPRLARNFRLLGKDIAVVFKLWWGEFSRYVDFEGRTTRRGLLAFCLVNAAVTWLFVICDAAPLVFLAQLGVFLPELASMVRRLRDTDISPWMVFAIPILPFLLAVPTVTDKDNADRPQSDESSQ